MRDVVILCSALWLWGDKREVLNDSLCPWPLHVVETVRRYARMASALCNRPAHLLAPTMATSASAIGDPGGFLGNMLSQL